MDDDDRDGHDFDFPTIRALAEIHGLVTVTFAAWQNFQLPDPRRAVYDKLVREHNRLIEHLNDH